MGVTRARLSRFYAVLALLLLPWIAYLYVTQVRQAHTDSLSAVVRGITVISVLACLFTAFELVRARGPAVVSGTFLAILAAVVLWFHLLTTGAHSSGGPPETVTLVYLLLLLVLGCLAALPGGGSGGGLATRRAGPWRRWALVIALVAVSIFIVIRLGRVHAQTVGGVEVTHLRIAWTVLDTAEFLALVSMARSVVRGGIALAVAGAATASLLVCDAWFNVAATSGMARMYAIAMAGIELPLAALSALLAVQALGTSVNDSNGYEADSPDANC